MPRAETIGATTPTVYAARHTAGWGRGEGHHESMEDRGGSARAQNPRTTAVKPTKQKLYLIFRGFDYCIFRGTVCW